MKYTILFSLIIFISCDDIKFDGYVCDKQDPNMIVQLPNIIDCNSAKAGSVKIELREINNDIYKSPAFVIYSINLTCQQPPSIAFWNRDIKRLTSYYNKNLTELLQINKTLKFDNFILKLDKNSNSFIYGKEEYDCNYNVFTSKETTNTFIRLKRSEVIYRKGYMLSDLAVTGECLYNLGICKIRDSTILVWKVDNNALDIYKKSKIIEADLIINNGNYHFSFPYHKNPITLVVRKNDFNNTDSSGFANTNEHSFSIKLIKVLKSKQRYKRDLSVEEIESELQYVSNLANENEVKLVGVCSQLAQGLLETYSLCVSNPYACISGLLKNNAISVFSFGYNYFAVTMCKRVEIIQFKPSYDSKTHTCNELIPVRYKFKNKLYDGYFNINNGRIFNISPFLKQGLCEDVRYLACSQNNTIDKYCKYNPYTGYISQFNNNIYQLSSNTFKQFENVEFSILDDIDKDLDGPSISQVLNRPFSFTEAASINHKSISDTILEKNTTTNVIISMCLVIIFLIILIGFCIWHLCFTKNNKMLKSTEIELKRRLTD